MRAHPIRFTAPIGDYEPTITRSEVEAAMLPEHPVDAGLLIDMTGRGLADGPALWARADELREAVTGYMKHRVHSSEVQALAVFGIAPIPLLMLLGRALGDLHVTTVYEKHRHSQSWRWGETAPTGAALSLHTPTRRRSPHVAVLLSISGVVQHAAVEAVLPGPCDLYEIRAERPRPDLIRTSEQLQAFTALWLDCLAQVRAQYQRSRRLHVFAAVPVSVAIECGRRVLPKADLPLTIYEYAGGGFTPAIQLDPLTTEVPMTLNLHVVQHALLSALGGYPERRQVYFGAYWSVAQSLPTRAVPADQCALDLQELSKPDRVEVFRVFLSNARRMAEQGHLASAVRGFDQALASLSQPAATSDVSPASEAASQAPLIVSINAQRVTNGMPEGDLAEFPSPAGGWQRSTPPGSTAWLQALGSVDQALKSHEVGQRPVHAIVGLPYTLALHFATRLEDRGQCWFWQHVPGQAPMCVSPGYLGQKANRRPVLLQHTEGTVVRGEPAALVVEITHTALPAEYAPSLRIFASDMPQIRLQMPAVGRTSLNSPGAAMAAAAQVSTALLALAAAGVSAIHLVYVGPVAVLMEAGRHLRVLSAPVVMHERAEIEGGFRYRPTARLVGERLEWIPTSAYGVEAESKLKLVFVVAQPSNAARINAGRELAKIRDELRSAPDRSHIEIGDIRTAANTDQIQRILREGDGNLLHFSGHGLEGGVLVLEAADGTTFQLDPELMIRMIKQANGIRERPGSVQVPYRFAVFNACWSSVLAEALVQAGVVEAAVGTKTAVHDNAAIAFAIAFYGALADGLSIAQAHESGRIQVLMAGHIPAKNADDFELFVAERLEPAKLTALM